MSPLLFCLAVHPLLSSLVCSLTVGYMDDFTLGGPLSTVAQAVATIKSSGAALGLNLNTSKCEVISNIGSVSNSQFTGFRQLSKDLATLLGASLSTGQSMDTMLASLYDDLKLAVDRLKLISSHDALVLLNNCLGGQKLLHMFRSSPCCGHPLLLQFDDLLRSAVTSICNVALTDEQWTQASLSVRSGGLGVRSVSMLASSAFLASAAGTRPLQTLILQKCNIAEEDINASLISWTSLAHTPANLHECSQRVWDSAVVDQSFQTLFNSQSEPYHRARLLAAAAIHSGDWLHALPISACGLRLNDEAVRVAVGLRLGTDICQPHQCVCGSIVDVRGSHALSCKRNAGRIQRHHHINDLVWRAMSRAGIAAVWSDQIGWQATGRLDPYPLA